MSMTFSMSRGTHEQVACRIFFADHTAHPHPGAKQACMPQNASFIICLSKLEEIHEPLASGDLLTDCEGLMQVDARAILPGHEAQ